MSKPLLVGSIAMLLLSACPSENSQHDDAGTNEDSGSQDGGNNQGTDGGSADAGDGGPGNGCGTCAFGQRCEGSGASAVCRSVRVLILDDDEAPLDRNGPSVELALLDAGLDVTLGPVYFAWDGGLTTSDGGSVDVVYWLQANYYSDDLLPEGEIALNQFVASGGGLVRTEWGGWNVADGDPPNVPPYSLLPVSLSTDYGEYAGDLTIDQPNHPLARDVSSAASYGGWTDAGVLPETQVVITSTGTGGDAPAGLPMVSFIELDGGARIIHLNTGLGYYLTPDGGLYDYGPGMDKVLRNAAIFGGHGEGPP